MSVEIFKANFPAFKQELEGNPEKEMRIMAGARILRCMVDKLKEKGIPREAIIEVLPAVLSAEYVLLVEEGKDLLPEYVEYCQIIADKMAKVHEAVVKELDGDPAYYPLLLSWRMEDRDDV